MRIAHLTTVDASLWYLLLPQLRAVMDVGGDAVGISAPGSLVGDLEAAGIAHVPLIHSTRGSAPKEDLKVIPELWRSLKMVHPDVLHTHNPKPGVYGRVVGRLAGVPVVLNTVHGLYATPEDRVVKRAVVYFLEAVASRFSDYELVQSVEDYELLTRWHITRPSRTILLGNGIDVRRFDPARFGVADRAAIRTEIGVAESDFVTGIVARLVRGKGFVELTEAAEMLGPQHVIVAIGPPDSDKGDALSPEEIARAEAAGIRFLGPRDDVDRLYAAMDAFVLPSHREGFPRAAMEAAAMGLPVATSDVRGCRQAVDDGVTGVLFPLRSAEGIADALNRFESDPVVRRRMGEAARAKALQEFDERRVVDTVLKVQVGALRERGFFERLEPSGSDRFTIRWAERADIRSLTGIERSVRHGERRRGASVDLRRLGRREHWRRRLKDVAVIEDEFGPVGFGLAAAHDRSLMEPGDVVIAQPFRSVDLIDELVEWVGEADRPSPS